jgi:hypothetical protein
VKKTPHVIFLLLLLPLFALFFHFADALKSWVFLEFQRYAKGAPSMSKVLFISDEFDLRDYNSLLDKLTKAQNSVVLFMPQVFNIKIEEYLDFIDPETVKIQKEEYEKFVIKLAEAENLIPVALSAREVEPADKIDLSQFGYFDAKSAKVSPAPFEYLKIKSKKVWYSAKVVGFYRDYAYYPYKVPLLFKNNKSVIAAAPVEAVRKYYKMTRSYVKLEEGVLKIGSVVSQPLLKSGEFIIRKPETAPRVYTREQVLAMDAEKLRDKIIVVKSHNVSEHTMISLGVSTAALMQGAYVRYSAALNYLLAALIAVVFFFAYRALRFSFGAIVLVLFELIITGAVIVAVNSSYYLDFAALSGANLLAFVTIYYYYLWERIADRYRRYAVIARYLHPLSARAFIKKNRDVRMRNSWIKAPLLYIDIDPAAAASQEAVKILFEKVRQLVYNKEKEFLIRALGPASYVVAFADDDMDPKYLMETAFYIRQELEGLKLNILVSNTEYYIFSHNNELVVLDRNPAIREASLKVDKARGVLLPEADIQKYVNIIKFQKLAARDSVTFFNAAGFREETTS